MKPIRLSLAGLQSYREKQEVDFTRLCDAGVFGIFGPTGSGKSTILDAMTLALYGKVERAPGGTQGIMNQAENALSVSFTFALSGAQGTETYRVDRQFKRGGDVSINNTVSRFVKLGADGETVLADKASEVNARVQEVLGLSMADFTRAVVLPQGKFAEFLSLKGVDRRQMLQRLFRLEPYGDLLNARLAVRYKETDMAIKQIEAEQLGLGDASQAALEQARQRMKETAAEAKAHRSLLQETEQAAEEAKRLKEWIAEKEEVVRGLKELELRREPMEQAKQALRKADQAARLQPYLNEWETTQRQLQAEAAGREAAKREHADAVVRHEAERTAYERDKQALEEQAGPLQQRLGQLQDALELEQEIADGERQEALLRTRLDAAASESAACGESLKQEQIKLDKAVKLQAELKEKLQQAEPKSEFRLAVQQALRDKQRADDLQAQLREMERENQMSVAAVDKEKALLASIAAKSGQTRRAYLQLSVEADALERRLKRLAADSAGMLAEAETELARMRESIRRRDMEEAAARLAELLAAGEACPVCGSPHHPAPAKRSADGHAEDMTPEEAERIRQRLSEETFMIRQLLQKAAALNESLRESLGGEAAAEAAAGKAAASIIDLAECTGGASGNWDNPPSWARLAAQTSQLSEAGKALAPALSRIERELRRLSGELQESSRLQAETEARLQTLQTLEHGQAAKRAELAGELEKILTAWAERHPGIAMEAVESEYERLVRLDREADELRSRLAKSDPYILEQQSKIAALQEQAKQLEHERVQAETELKGRVMLLEEKRRRLSVQLGGDQPAAPIRALLEDTKALAERLKRSEADSRARLEQAQQTLQQAGNRLAAAEQAYASAAAAYERADANWRESLRQAGFADAAEVKTALLEETRLRRLEEELASFAERQASLQLRLEQLQDMIGEREITDEGWLEVQARLTAARERQEELLQQAAKAERDAEELEAKHARWMELEKIRGQQKQLRERLSQLQTVFRGNAFVEYIAEEQLIQVSRAASERLGLLTRQRYALEVDSSGGFVIRDDANGGVRRPVSTLSGGETFLTSLALALALSAQIQLNGKFPLEFFFLDEGFGTLDPDLLETVIGALERLHMERLTVGVISHVPELKARLPRKLVVTAAEPSGSGSRIHYEAL